MTHTEEEAKKCWCPFARAAEQSRLSASDPMVPVAAVNRGSDAIMSRGMNPSSPHCLCIASECMAWEWAEPKSIPPGALKFVAGKSREQRGDCGLKR